MATIDNLDLAQGRQATHVQSAEGDAFILGSELLKENPNLLNKYFKQGSRNMTTLQKLNAFGFGRVSKSASSSPFTGHYEKPAWKKTITVGSITAGSNNNEAVITLAASDMVTTDPGNGLTYVQSRPRVGETVQAIAMGSLYRIIAKDTVSSPHTITVQTNSNESPLDEIVAGEELMIGASIKGEFTGQIKPLRPRRYRYQNTFWITDDTEAVSGSHLTTEVRFQPVPGSNLLWMEGFKDMELRNEYNKGNIWMFGQQTEDNAWVQFSEGLEENVNIPGTQGLLDFVKQSGFNFQYDPNDVSIEDMYALSNYYQDINLGTNEILLIQGSNIHNKFERALSDKLSYDWVIGVSDKYISESMRNNWGKGLDRDYNPNGAFLNMGINGFALGGYTFMQTAAPEFNDAKGPGAIGYKDVMVAAPFGLASVEGPDNVPYIGYEYRGSNGYNRENEVWTKAGAGNSAITGRSDFYKTSQLDGVFFYVRSEIAPHFALGEQFSLFTPEGASS